MPPSPTHSGRLNNRIAIITGTSSGLGRAIALAYIREGCSVACADITPTARLESPHETEFTTLELLRRDAPEERSMYVQCDVSNAEDVEKMVGRCVERWGRVDILVNNAGTATKPSDDNFDKTIAVNARSVFLCSKYAIKQMLTQEPHPSGDRGWIVNVASIAGLVGVGTPDYAASKGAVVQLTKSIAIDYARERIHCNAICPGFVQTGLLAQAFEYVGDHTAALAARHPFRGLGEVEDVVGPAVFLASEDAKWVTGVPLAVDGGYTAQ